MENQKVQRELQGRVVSQSMDKGATVLVERRVKHRLYPKIITRSKKYAIHDPKNECGIGDLVRIREGARMSKRIAWHLAEIIEKAK